MPVVTLNPIAVPGQVNQRSMAGTTQKNFRQMVGEVQQWNADAPILMVMSWLNKAYREVLDKRLWYGLMVRGQVVTPNVYTTGTASFTLNSANVVGSGTAWDQSFVGRQIRAGFQTGWYNIKSVTNATNLVLDLPWGNQTVNNSGYQCLQTWVTLGYNIKMVLEMVNQRQGYPLYVNVPQKSLNQVDTWRTQTGWTRILANREPTADGKPQYELWPAPSFQQVFPFLAYTQTPDMDADDSYPAPFIRSDILVSGAMREALLFGGSRAKYYDASVAAAKAREFLSNIEDLKNMDDNLYPKDLLFDNLLGGGGGMGSTWAQSHDI